MWAFVEIVASCASVGLMLAGLLGNVWLSALGGVLMLIMVAIDGLRSSP